MQSAALFSLGVPLILQGLFVNNLSVHVRGLPGTKGGLLGGRLDLLGNNMY